MTKEVISLQVGQCGNKIGTEFWKQICVEHGINKDGTLINNTKLEDRKDVFFYENDGHYYSRAILFDLEPRVVQGILTSEYKNLFNKENIFLSKDGSGAGNNWGMGYSYSQMHEDELLNLIDKEADSSDNLQAFILSHSISGGTGSGMGSYLLELLNENYSKKIIKTFSVFPQLNNSSDVVVQPYNSILSLKRLILNADMVTVIDNTSLNNLLTEKHTIQQSNSIVSDVMSNITSCLRYPGPINNDLISLISSLVIIPRCHFLISSYSPINIFNKQYNNRLTVFDIIRKLYQSSNMLVSTDIKNGKYISALNILRGQTNINPNEVYKSLEKIKQRHLVNFIKWNPCSLQVNISKQSQLTNNKLSGLLLANHTSINQLFDQCIGQYNKLYNRKAFLDNYKKVDIFSSADGKGNFEEMEHSKEVVELVKDEYIRAEQDDYYSLSYINYFRDEKLLKELRESEVRRCETNSVVDKVIDADNDWKKAMYSYDQLKKSLNEMSKKVSEYAKLNRDKGDLSKDSEFINLKSIAESKKEGIAECLKNIEECNDKRNNLLKMVGNLVQSDVVASKDEKLNDVLRSWVPNFFPWESKQTTNNNKDTNLNNINKHNVNLNTSETYNHTGLPGKLNNDKEGTYYERKLPEVIRRPPWKVLQHHEILARLNSLEVNKGIEISGHRGYFLKGKGCMLNLALIQYGLNFLVRRGFLPVHTPYLMRKEVMSECAELDDFEETLYCIPPLNTAGLDTPTQDGGSSTDVPGRTNKDRENLEKDLDKNKLFLIATSEQPLSALHRNEVYSKKQLPLKYAGISTCFRREAGAHGKDLRGIFRVHQFQKVEQFVVCTPENSRQLHEEMVSCSEEFYRSLKLPFRVVSIVAGALNKAASKKYDLEAWFPGYEDYRELVSCSNCTDYQSRNLNSRFYDKNNQDKKHVHMLNGTLVASQRCLCCILENYQTPDGVIVPEALVPYMDGQDFIPFES